MKLDLQIDKLTTDGFGYESPEPLSKGKVPLEYQHDPDLWYAIQMSM
jgi:hypothetical protein